MTRLIDTIRLKHGSRNGAHDAPELDASKLTVIVGPNNSGKTTFLKELNAALTYDSLDKSTMLIIDDCLLREFSEPKAKSLIESVTIKSSVNAIGNTHVEIGWGHGSHVGIDAKHTIETLCCPPGSKPKIRWAANLLRLFTRNLDGLSRLTLANGVAIDDARSRFSSFPLRNAFLCDDCDYERFDETVFQAIGQHVAITPILNGGQASVLLTKDSMLEVQFDSRSYSNDAIEYFSNPLNALPLHQQGDGTVAFVGLMIELMFSKQSILLIDEPEAFLHPTLAHAVGNEAGRQSYSKSIFAVTHSADFLMGCLESCAQVNIVRLTREGAGTARLLPDHDVRKMITDPLLRSENIISALFHSCAVIVEGDSDCAFYREVNYRLSAVSDRSLRDCQFVSTHGKGSMYKPLALLRKAGIPTACVVDFDVLDGKKRTLGNLASAAMVPSQILSSVKHEIGMASLEIKKCHEQRRGLDMLEDGIRETIRDAICKLARYGIFVVPNGELESWLSCLNVDREKDGWVNRMFERMGNDPEDVNYIQPSDDDVWDFIRGVSEWCEDSARCGMSV